MNWRLMTFFACTTSALVGLPQQVQTLESSTSAIVPVVSSSSVASPLQQVKPSPNIVPKPEVLATQQLEAIAESITVKVLVGENSGSGILIRHTGHMYTVLTNEHVLERGHQYRIVTTDGQVHPASVEHAAKFDGNDLAMLQFSSNRATYTVASLGTASSVKIGDEVFAGGFPQEEKGFSFTIGQVVIATDKALQGGYQLGYTNDIQKGMSGGPVLNSHGEVVAVNGMHAYPLWGDPYTYKDGSKPCQAMRQLMANSAFAIPIETFKQLVKGAIAPFDSHLPHATIPSTRKTFSQYVPYSTSLLQQQASAAKSCVSNKKLP